MERFESFINTEFIGEQVNFEDYKTNLQNRYKKLKKHLCLPIQKTFIQRLDSQLDDKNAWLNSISQSVVGKPLNNFKDEDEFALYDKFKTLISDLDSLTNLSEEDVNEETEEAFGIEFSSFSGGIKKSFIRLPKAKSFEANSMQENIKKLLTKDKTLLL